MVGHTGAARVLCFPLTAPFLVAGMAMIAVLIALVQVAVLVHVVARPVPGLGVAVPAFLPGIVAALAAVLLHQAAVAALASAGGAGHAGRRRSGQRAADTPLRRARGLGRRGGHVRRVS